MEPRFHGKGKVGILNITIILYHALVEVQCIMMKTNRLDRIILLKVIHLLNSKIQLGI